MNPGRVVTEAECLPKSRIDCTYKSWQHPNLPPHPVLILCSTEAEVKYAAEATDLSPNAMVALTPQAACQCYLQDIPYYKLEDFFDITAFWDGDEPMLTLQIQWADQVDALLWQTFPEFHKCEFRPAGDYFFWLKGVIDMLFRTVFGLTNLLVATKPRHVYSFASEQGIDDYPPRWGRETLFFNGNLHSFVVPSCAKEYRVPVTILPAQRQSAPAQAMRTASAQPLVRRLFHSLPLRWQYAAHQMKNQGIKGFLSGRYGRAKARLGERLEIMLGSAFDLNRALLEEHGFKVTQIGDATTPDLSTLASSGLTDQQLAKAWEELTTQQFFREPFFWCGVDLFRVAESRLHYWFHVITPRMWRMRKQAYEHFKRNRPDAVLFYSPESLAHHAVIQAARSLRIPVITHQHGSLECEYTILDMVDMRVSDYRFVYGAGQANYLRERSARYAGKRAEVVPVGSAYIDGLARAGNRRAETRRRLGVTEEEQLVVYIPTSYQHNWYMARQSYLGVPYFDLLTRVIETIAGFPNLRFVYKPFPELPRDPMITVIASRYPNFQVTDIAPPQLFQASDAIIIDMPSTALLEATLTDKPILVFSDRRCIALRPEARELLRKRVSLSETPEDFLKLLQEFLSKGNFEPLANPNREFLQVYGTYLDDGRSTERAMKALEEIIKTHISSRAAVAH